MAKGAAFPRAGRFEINSFPIFLLSQGDRAEILVCKANMVVETGEPAGTGAKRQIGVKVLDWVATGRSRLLGGKVEFRMTQGSRQPKSWVRAGREGDLPGQARFAMRYQVTTPRGSIDNLTGVASGPIRSFPPKGDVFRVDKTLAIGDLRVAPVACLCPADLNVVATLPDGLG